MSLSKGDKTKSRLIDSAINLFSKHGFDGTSFQLIAEDCELTQPAAFYYFKSKEELLLGVLAKILQHNHELVSAMSQNGTPMQKILAHFEGNLTWALRYPKEAQIILLLYYSGSYNKEFAKKYTQILDTARQRILQYIFDGITQKCFKIDISQAQIVAEVLHDLLLGGIVNILATQATKRIDPLQVTEKWRRSIEALCRAKPS